MTADLDSYPTDSGLRTRTLSRPEFARRVVGAMSDAVLVLDPCHKVVTANDATFALLEYSRTEILGASFATIFPEASIWIHAKISAHLDMGDEVTFVNRAGRSVPMSISISDLPRASNEKSIVVVLRDVTEIHRLMAQLSIAKDEAAERAIELEEEVRHRTQVEEELREAKRGVEQRLDEVRTQLLRTERLATLGTLAGGVGHELNNVAMIQRICVGEAEELLETGAVDAEFVQQLKCVDGHLANHARRLLNLARPGPDYTEPLDLRRVVKETLSILRGSGRTKVIDVLTSFPETELIVRVNRARIEQILMNLVGNAADAVGLKKNGEQSIRVTASADPERGRVICEVGDTGPGISPENLERIFDAFYTTKAPGAGTGLGLPVVKQIIESYGGELNVHSIVGMGTCFSFDLHLPAVGQEE